MSHDFQTKEEREAHDAATELEVARRRAAGDDSRVPVPAADARTIDEKAVAEERERRRKNVETPLSVDDEPGTFDGVSEIPIGP